MDGDKADAAFGHPLDPLSHGLADIEHLGVEKDLFAATDQIVEQPVEAGGEFQPQPDFEKRNHPVEPVDKRARRADARHVERHDQPIFDPFGDFARERHSTSPQTAMIAAEPSAGG